MRAIGLISLCLVALGAEAVEVYRSVAPDGTVIYSDRPADAGAQSVQVVTSRATPAPVAARSASRNAPAPAVVMNAAEATVAMAEAEREQAEERARNCEIARERVERYSTAHRLYRTLPNGEREYLDDAEIDEARVRAAADVDTWCT